MCFYLRNWQVTFLLYTLGVFISEYTAKAFTEPRDYRVVFLIQSPEVPKGTFRECKRSPRSRASPDFGLSPLQKAQNPFQRLCAFLIHPHTIFDYPVLIFYALLYALFLLVKKDDVKEDEDKNPDSQKGQAVQTGDQTPIMFWAFMLVASAVVIFRRRKRA